VTATLTPDPGATGTAAATTPTATPTPPTTLPETGQGDWSIIVIGLTLLLIMFGARRLRRA
jgi:LPXTG-motif cell wall-anchored protein